MDLNDIRDQVYSDACEHGLWRENHTLEDAVLMVRAEVMELLQEAAKGEVTDALCEELADVVIMCFSLAGRFGIDICRWIWYKIGKNMRRPWRHEGEKA